MGKHHTAPMDLSGIVKVRVDRDALKALLEALPNRDLNTPETLEEVLDELVKAIPVALRISV